jgi:hypothetical protein
VTDPSLLRHKVIGFMRAVPKKGAASTRSSGKTCLFCERGGKMSKEHLWPKWAQAAITPAQRGQRIRNALHDGPGEPYKVWEAPVFEATLKDVCVECNNGWMSKIEAAAKPFALPLMQGRSLALASEAQRKLALWAYLKCSLFQTMEQNTGVRAALANAHPIFYERQAAGMLAPIVSVFTARHVGVLVGQYQHRLLGASPNRPVAFIQTFTAGELVLQVIRSYLGGSILEPTRDPRVAGCDHRIWPVTGMFTWPSGDALSDADLAIYTGPQVKGTSTSRLIYPT